MDNTRTQLQTTRTPLGKEDMTDLFLGMDGEDTMPFLYQLDLMANKDGLYIPVGRLELPVVAEANNKDGRYDIPDFRLFTAFRDEFFQGGEVLVKNDRKGWYKEHRLQEMVYGEQEPESEFALGEMDGLYGDVLVTRGPRTRHTLGRHVRNYTDLWRDVVRDLDRGLDEKAQRHLMTCFRPYDTLTDIV